MSSLVQSDGGSGVSGIANGDGCHSSSSSVGAPDDAGCGSSKPTGEEPGFEGVAQ